MANATIESQIQNLEFQVQLQESNYRYAMELKKDSGVLRRMRYNIKALKELLQSLKEYSKKTTRHTATIENIYKGSGKKPTRKYGFPSMRQGNTSD